MCCAARPHIDPQGSAGKWFKAWASSNELIAIQAQAEALPALLKKAKDGGVDFVIIDSAPHSDKAAVIAAKLADYVLIPQKATTCYLAAPATMF